MILCLNSIVAHTLMILSPGVVSKLMMKINIWMKNLVTAQKIVMEKQHHLSLHITLPGKQN